MLYCCQGFGVTFKYNLELVEHNLNIGHFFDYISDRGAIFCDAYGSFELTDGFCKLGHFFDGHI